MASVSGTVLGWTHRRSQEWRDQAPTLNQVRGACKCEDVFAGKRKIMRKHETIWKLLKAAHGKQVASFSWQRLARRTLCEDRWTVLISVPCAGYNETKDSLVLFHGEVTTTMSTTAGALVLGGHWLVMRSVIREVRDLSSCECEFHGKGIRSSEGIVDKLHLPQR